MSIYNCIILLILLVVTFGLAVAHHKEWLSKRLRDTLIFAAVILGALGVLVPLFLESNKDKPTMVTNGLPIKQDSSTATRTSDQQRIPESFIDRIALKLMYGDDADIVMDDENHKSYVRWTPSRDQMKKFFGPDLPDDQATSQIIMTLPYYSNGTDNYLILTETKPYSDANGDLMGTCHACAPVIGGAVLSLQDGVWVVAVRTLDIDNIGAWGKIPDGNLVVIGKDKYAVMFELTDGGQGIVNTWMTMIGVVGSSLKVILDAPVSGNNTNAGCTDEVNIAKQKGRKTYIDVCYEYVSRHTFIMNEKSDYYDLVVKYAGTDDNEDGNSKTDSNNVKDVTRTDIYQFDGSKYTLTKSVKQDPIMPIELVENE